jgi:L-ascorbate metabolism protein UlaG (beta-lactamase superfamily)
MSAKVDDIEFERIIQSSFCIKAGGLVVYVDPHRVSGGEKADLIFVSHDHFDHLDPSAIATVQKADTVIVTNGPCARRLEGKGNIVSIEEGQTVTEKGVEITAVPAYNSFHPRGDSIGFVFTLAGKRIYHAGDTNLVPEMAELGPVDVALIPIGGTYTMDEPEAAEAVKTIRPKTVIPMHYGYATGGDPKKFASLVEDTANVIIT